MPKLRLPKESADSPTNAGQGKQKRKNSHTVRRFFKRESETTQRCTFCGWETRDNATRMVQHIVSRCNSASAAARAEMSATVEDAEKREQASFYTSFNKKDVHGLFTAIENDRKRMCVYCKWTTVLNLTRMRNHIMMLCSAVPPNVRQRFIKAEHSEDSQSESYCIIKVENGDQKGFQLVSSSSVENSGAEPDAEQIGELIINTADYEQQEDLDGYYDEPTSDVKIVEEIEVLEQGNVPSEDEEGETEIQFIATNDGYYTVCKNDSDEIRQMDEDDEPVVAKRPRPEPARPEPARPKANIVNEQRVNEGQTMNQRTEPQVRSAKVRVPATTSEQETNKKAPMKAVTRQSSRKQQQKRNNSPEVRKERSRPVVAPRGPPSDTSTPLPKMIKQGVSVYNDGVAVVFFLFFSVTAFVFMLAVFSILL